ncbi:hypothetical protein A0J61_02721 [Choanephora cucurbitarum]|uniref:BZIP domain-containing protein n=1 Tax=Choanephora cucurbitarum TaxID=101091 RepID=A0A1C7NJA7_9FUNG|nr:hypothetical protein A0J61_02721 [Choanephora cucurbitarum]
MQQAPLSPPDSFKSRSPSLSPQSEYMPCPTEERRRNSLQLPMSIEERRYRNKLASAKYRAKKQASMKSMTAKVSQLMASNSNLQRELAKAKQENEVLRAMLLNQQQSTRISTYSVPSPPHIPPASFY